MMTSSKLFFSLTLWIIVVNAYAVTSAPWHPKAQRRTTPPSGSYVVRQNTTTSGEYSTISAAIAALPADNSSQSVFIYPGIYNESVYVARNGPTTIYGYTQDTYDYTHNEVTIVSGQDASEAGSNDLSGTLRNHNTHFSLYNVNLNNTFGLTAVNCQCQAIAYSSQANFSGLYGVSISGYQDTLLANFGQQVYLRSYIEGAVDFIFGTNAMAYFEGNTIAVNGASNITASGRNSDDNGSYVFNYNTVVRAPANYTPIDGNVYLGRPWHAFAKVIFKNTYVIPQLGSTVWNPWHPTQPNTANITFAEYKTTGPGTSNLQPANFSTELTPAEAEQYNIVSALGTDYASWVDTSYLIGGGKVIS